MKQSLTMGLILLVAALAPAQTVKYSDLTKGGKLPYGKAVTITGDLSDLVCGQQKITDLLTVTTITASYLGQTTTAGAGTVSGSKWVAPLGTLPADTAVNLLLKIGGKIALAKRAAIVIDLFASDQFQRGLRAFMDLTSGQSSTVATEEAARLLRDISDPSGALTAALQHQLPCVTITDVSTAALSGLRANLPALLNLKSQRLKNLLELDPKLPGLAPEASLGEAYSFVTSKDFHAPEGKAATSVNLFKRDYELVLDAFGGDVVAQLSEGVQLDTPTTTTDLAKYAGFDVGQSMRPGSMNCASSSW